MARQAGAESSRGRAATQPGPALQASRHGLFLRGSGVAGARGPPWFSPSAPSPTSLPPGVRLVSPVARDRRRSPRSGSGGQGRGVRRVTAPIGAVTFGDARCRKCLRWRALRRAPRVTSPKRLKGASPDRAWGSFLAELKPDSFVPPGRGRSALTYLINWPSGPSSSSRTTAPGKDRPFGRAGRAIVRQRNFGALAQDHPRAWLRLRRVPRRF